MAKIKVAIVGASGYTGEEPGRLPDTKNIAGTNYLDVAVRADARTNRLIAFSLVDNIVKGAGGQAVQSLNLMFGLDEATGLL